MHKINIILILLLVGSVYAAAPEYDLELPGCGFQRAIDASEEGDTVALPKGTFILHRGLWPKARMHLAGNDTVFIVPQTPAIAKVAAAPKKGENAVRVEDSSAFIAGMEVALRYAPGQEKTTSVWTRTGIISEVKKDRLILAAPVPVDWNGKKSIHVGNVFSAVYIDQQGGVTLSGITVRGRHAPDGESWGSGAFFLAAFSSFNCGDITIRDCVAENWPSDGFSMQSGGNVRVYDCEARGNAVHGFHVGTWLTRSWIGHVLAEDNGSCGLFYCLGNNEVIASRSTFRNNSDYGIGNIGDAGDTDCLVIDNTCEKNGRAGIHTGMYYSNTRTCTKCFVVRNKCSGNGGTNGTEILLEDSVRMVIYDNELVCVPGGTAIAEGTVHRGCYENYIVSNRISQACAEAVKIQSKKTIVTNTWPGPVPEERQAVLKRLVEAETRYEADYLDYKRSTK